ncbi:MAG: hypothetical protein AAGI53_07135 [Planctomycetota bacterium]
MTSKTRWIPAAALALCCLAGCGVSDAGKTTLAPGESASWRLEGKEIEFEVRNTGPALVEVTGPANKPFTLADSDMVSKSHSNSDKTMEHRYEIVNLGDEDATIRWKYCASSGASHSSD